MVTNRDVAKIASYLEKKLNVDYKKGDDDYITWEELEEMIRFAVCQPDVK